MTDSPGIAVSGRVRPGSGEANASRAEKSVVSVRGLRHEFAGRPVLDIPEWRVDPGGHSLVLGPSGCGKTTFLNILAGLMRPTAGAVVVAGQDLGAMAPGVLDVFRGRHIGIVFQALHLVNALSVGDNLRLARYMAGMPEDPSRVERVLDGLGLAAMAGARPRTLSQGEAQRVAIARAVINEPVIILADEPTSALDDANAERVLDLLSEQAAACQATLVIATHDRRIRNRFATVLELEPRP